MDGIETIVPHGDTGIRFQTKKFLRERTRMPQYTPERAKEELVDPLVTHAKRLLADLKRFRKAVRNDELAEKFLPLNAGMYQRALLEIEKFESQFRLKLKGALAGSFRYREDEKTKKRQRYRDKTRRKPPETDSTK